MIRLEMTRKQEAILAAIIIFAALGIFVLYLGIGRAPAEPAEPEPEPEPAPPPLSAIIEYHMDQYNELDETYLEMLEDGDYTLDSPLIIANPYGSSTLTALVLFKTEELAQISVHITGKTDDTSIDHTFSGFDTSHRIPILGLYPDTANLVEITAVPQNQTAAKTVSAIHIITAGSVPEHFPANLIQNSVEDPDETGFYFTHVNLSAFDTNGDYRWFYHFFGTTYPTLYTSDGTVLMIVGTYEEENTLLLELDMLGKVISMEYVDEEFELSGRSASFVEQRLLYPAP